MAKLIKDILGYSQLANEHEIFEMVNLQKIVENVKNDYELMIDQKKAIILCENLPTIYAIPLQMSQLFGNLLSNSLKYAKTNERPIISISARLLTEQEAAKEIQSDSKMDYYKIEFKDNGIGFKQEYADRIFNIFQRLHGKTEFVGTGIGLAMCKKIAQNHYGKIYATGNPGNGATFSILLANKSESN